MAFCYTLVASCVESDSFHIAFLKEHKDEVATDEDGKLEIYFKDDLSIERLRKSPQNWLLRSHSQTMSDVAVSPPPISKAAWYVSAFQYEAPALTALL